MKNLLYFVENLKLGLEANDPVVVEDPSKYMAVLNNCNHLLQIVQRDLNENFFEKFLVVVKVVAKTEFRFKILPNAMVFQSLWFQYDFIQNLFV